MVLSLGEILCVDERRGGKQLFADEDNQGERAERCMEKCQFCHLDFSSRALLHVLHVLLQYLAHIEYVHVCLKTLQPEKKTSIILPLRICYPLIVAGARFVLRIQQNR